jgi:hypothetical protein
MDRLQIVRQIQTYLDRTPITGEEATAMVVCRHYMKQQEGMIMASAPRASFAEPPEPPTPPSQVADMSGK